MRKIFVLLIIFVIFFYQPAASETQYSDDQTVKILISALHKRDFSDVFKVIKAYQDKIHQIENDNPKVLWDKFTKQYFDEMNMKFLNNQISWAETLLFFIPQNASWVVIEIRKYEEQSRVYVKFSHNIPETSPFLEDIGFLKEGIFEFSLIRGLVNSFSRIEAGDVFWETKDLHKLLNSDNENLREKTAIILTKYGDERGKMVLEQIQEKKKEDRIIFLISQISSELEKDPEFPNSFEGIKMVRELVSYRDPKAAELLVEIILIGTGSPHWVADDAAKGLVSIGSAALPAVENALKREAEYRQIWKQRGWTKPTATEWRIERLQWVKKRINLQN